MKKLFIPLFILFGVILFNTTVYAQTETMIGSAQIDEQTQKKIDKATEDLAKGQKKLEKMTADYDKAKVKFEKQQAKGKLSPNDITKEEHSLEKSMHDIDKLKHEIEENEKFLAPFKKQ